MGSAMHWMVWMAVSNAAELIGAELDWYCVNDTVMGGVSQSSVARDEDAVVFSGTLSLEQNGGFTSVRSQPAELSLDGTTGFRLRLRGDGRTYDFTARRDDVPIRGGSYRVPIQTVADEEVMIEVSLAEFTATTYGRPLASAPPLALAPERIASVGFLLADKQPGPFSLTVLSIEPIRDTAATSAAPPPDLAGRAAVEAALSRAISRGVPVYNQGDPALCAAIYQTAIESVMLLAEGALSEAEQGVLMQSLQGASQQAPAQAAWTLRYGMDAVLAQRAPL